MKDDHQLVQIWLQIWRVLEPHGPSIAEAVEAHYFDRVRHVEPSLRDSWLRCTINAAETHGELHNGLARIARRLHAEAPDAVLPRVLVDWLVDVSDRAPPSGRGAVLGMRPSTGGRDIAIVKMIEVVRVVADIHATRNDATEATSACDVVAELTGLSYERVRQLWRRDHREATEALWRSGVLRVGNG